MTRWTAEQLAELKARGNVREHRISDAQPERAKAPRRPKLPEKDVLKGCLEILRAHPAVAFGFRANSGMAYNAKGQPVRFGFRGQADILGMLKGGRWFCVECKATGKRPTPEQQAFLDTVRAHGGLALCVDDPAQLAARLSVMPTERQPTNGA